MNFMLGAFYLGVCLCEGLCVCGGSVYVRVCVYVGGLSV